MASTCSQRIVSYPSGSTFGTLNVAGNAAHQLNYPEGLVYGSFSNSLIIADGVGQTIVRWYSGSTNWTLIAGVPGVAGSNATYLNRPIGLTMDPIGNIYVAEFNNGRVQLFLTRQSNGVTIAGTGLNGTIISAAGGVKLDSQLNLFVSHYNLNRIVKFSRY